MHPVIGAELERAVDVGQVGREGTYRSRIDVREHRGAAGGPIGLPQLDAGCPGEGVDVVDCGGSAWPSDGSEKKT
jgi:hypothetical protein